MAGMNPNCNGDGFHVEKSYSRRRRSLQSSSSSSSGAKKLKCESKHQQQEEEEEEEDMISNLPESLLHHIFSYLDIKHAVHTCVLSKRWRNFWVSIPTLNFVYRPGSIPGHREVTSKLASKKKPLNLFADFINLVLMLRDNSNIHRFSITSLPTSRVHEGDPIHITSNLDIWILIAVLRNVEEISLNVSCRRLPHCLFTCRSLTKLEIHNFRHGLSQTSYLPDTILDKISLPRLKTLYLESVYFGDKSLTDRIFPNCPNLESLILHECNLGRGTFDFCSLKLKELVFRNCITAPNIWFNLNVPNLISFHYYNIVKFRTFGCVEKEKYVLHLVHILKQLRNVEDLKLSASYLEFLTRAPEYLLDSLTEFCNLRCLMLEVTCISKDFYKAVSYLLKLSPNLKSFGVTTHGAPFLDGWETAGFSSDENCVMMNYLTVFELRDVKGRDCELNFIEVLLKNAKVLERLVIDFAFSIKESCFIFKETVLALPRSSLSSTILFK